MDNKQKEIKRWIDEIEKRKLLDEDEIEVLRRDITEIEIKEDEGYNTFYLSISLFNFHCGTYCDMTYEDYSNILEIDEYNID